MKTYENQQKSAGGLQEIRWKPMETNGNKWKSKSGFTEFDRKSMKKQRKSEEIHQISITLRGTSFQRNINNSSKIKES